MIFTLDHKEVTAALKRALTYVMKRPSLDLLNHMLVTYKNQECIFYTTDLEAFLAYKLHVALPASSDDEISFIIPNVREFSKSIRGFGKEITFTISDESIKITDNGTSTIVFPCETSSSEYPDTNWFYDYDYVKCDKYNVNPNELHNQYLKIKHAVSKDDGRPIIQAVLIDSDWMVGLDGFQMALVPLSNPLGATVLTNSKMLENADIMGDEAILYIDTANERFVLTNNYHYIAGSILDAKYPAYEQVLPEIGKHTDEITFNRMEMINILNAFMSQGLKTRQNQAVTFENGVISFKKDGVESSTQLTGEIKNSRISFNGERLLSAIKNQFTGEFIYMAVWNPDRPIMIQDNIEENGLQIIMPIFLED